MRCPYLKEALTKELDLKKIADMVRTRIEVFPEIKDMVDFFETLPEYDTDHVLHIRRSKTMPRQLPLNVLKAAASADSGGTGRPYSNDALFADAEDLCGGKWLQDRLCDVAAAYRCFRKAR